MELKSKVFFFLMLSLLSLGHSTEESYCSDKFNSSLESKCNSIYLSYQEKCSYFEGNCIRTYSECSYYKGNDTSACESIKYPKSYKCKLVDGKCQQFYTTCDDYALYERASEGFCGWQNLYKSATNKCVYTGKGCKEVYKTCELYDEIAQNKNQEDCESIDPPNIIDKSDNDYFSECKFENGHCIRKKRECEKMNINYCRSQTTNKNNTACIKIDGACKTLYGTCANYNQEENKNKETCENLILIYPTNKDIDYNHKCVFENNNCVKKKKTCEDYKPGQPESYCNNIEDAVYGWRCRFINGTCSYDKCPYNLILDEKICNSIVPKDETKKCARHKNGGFCVETTKNCSEYTGNNSYLCSTCITSDSTKYRCALKNNKCIEEYKTCETYSTYVDTVEKSVCESISYQYGNCVFKKGETKNECITEPFKCENFTTPETCNGFNISDTKKCVYKNDKCIEAYKECSSYDGTNIEECASIEPIDSANYYCDYFNNECKKRYKYCRHAKTEEECYNIYLSYDGTYKGCYWNGEECLVLNRTSMFASYYCLYQIGATKENSICVHYDRDQNHPYQTCELEESGDTFRCILTYKKCEDITDKNFCRYGAVSNFKKCVWKNNKCEEHYKDCDSYNRSSEIINKEVCENIENYYSYYRCVFTESGDKNKCEMKPILCKDALNSSDCSRAQPEDNSIYKCSWVNNSTCIQKYKSCDSYNQNSDVIEKSYCESIIPIYSSSYKKCAFIKDGNNNTCKEVNKNCSEINDEDYCRYGVASGSDKNCVFKNNKCVEQYKTCQSYNKTGNVEKYTCESIILSEKGYRCGFIPGTINKCEKVKTSCDDYKLNLDYVCSDINAIQVGKKCTYSDSNICSETDKTCLELTDEINASEEICSAAKTSNSGKTCKLKADNSGCEEIDDDSKGDNPKEDNPKGNNPKGNNPKGNGFWLDAQLNLLAIIIALLA